MIEKVIRKFKIFIINLHYFILINFIAKHYSNKNYRIYSMLKHLYFLDPIENIEYKRYAITMLSNAIIEEKRKEKEKRRKNDL